MGKVLIIEDEVSIAELERDYLEISGFEVDISTDGKEGLDKALSEDYDFAVNNAVKVVVNDMALPSVKTGDTFNAIGLSMMFVGGLAVAVFLFLKKKQFAE